MKKIILLSLSVALFSACNNEAKQSEVTTDNAAIETKISSVSNTEGTPVFKFQSDVFDFGQITEGDKVSHEFTFTNTGNVPLIISGATATCGCTVPEYPTAPVPPNGTGKISVTFDSKGKFGMQNKVVTITANTIPAVTELRLLGDIKSPPTANN